MSSAGDDLVERVVEVTGASASEAKHLLGACNNDVESAVALYFEQGGDAADPDPVEVVEDEVRAPIAPIREQLIGPEDDNFLVAPPITTTGRLSRLTQRVKVCPLRDFAREGALMEEQMQAAAAVSTSSGSVPRPWTSRAAAMATAASKQESVDLKPSSSRLGDLFRPPTDIAFAGTFQAARTRATALCHWLLVNVQGDNFDSQLLNRDVWSDKEVRKVIRRQFMLWQVDADSTEGRRFVTFYHCAKLPYVCVVDPRTGEEMWKSAEPKNTNLLTDLLSFLQEHKDITEDDAEDVPSTSKRSKIVLDDDAENEHDTKKRTKLMELSEEEQIALAIRNSMRENGSVNGDSKDGTNGNNDDDDSSDFASIEEFGDDDAKSACERISFETQLGSATEELTALKLRLLNAEGVDEMVQLRWPSDTLLQVLRLYIAQKHIHVTKSGSYKLICAFPRKTLEAEHDGCSLKQLGLHPSANLHITLDE